MNKTYTYKQKSYSKNFNNEFSPLKISYHTLEYVRLYLITLYEMSFW